MPFLPFYKNFRISEKHQINFTEIVYENLLKHFQA